MKAAKNGELVIQLQYAIGFCLIGAKFIPVAINLMERKGVGRLVEAWFLNNNETKGCIKTLTEAYHEKKIGPAWNYMAMKMMKAVLLRGIPYGTENVPAFRKGKYEVSFLTTYIKCAETTDGTVARILEFGEFLKAALVRTEPQGGSKFVELYKSLVSMNLWNNVPNSFESNLMNISVETEEYDTMDIMYMNDDIRMALCYCFQKTTLAGAENIQIKALGWKNP